MKRIKSLLFIIATIFLTSCGTPCIDAVDKLIRSQHYETHAVQLNQLEGGFDMKGNVVIRNLIENSADVVVLSQPEKPAQRSHQLLFSRVPEYTISCEVPIYRMNETPLDGPYIKFTRPCEEHLHFEIRRGDNASTYRSSIEYPVEGSDTAALGLALLYPIALAGDITLHALIVVVAIL